MFAQNSSSCNWDKNVPLPEISTLENSRVTMDKRE